MDAAVKAHALLCEDLGHIIEERTGLNRSKLIRDGKIELSCKSGVRSFLDLLNGIPERFTVPELCRGVFTENRICEDHIFLPREVMRQSGSLIQ